jgi:formylglycine-generating enzyme
MRAATFVPIGLIAFATWGPGCGGAVSTPGSSGPGGASGGGGGASASAGSGGVGGHYGGNSGNGGADASAGTGGCAGTGDASSGCGSCDPKLEQCWNNQLCVAKLVSITGGYSIDATEVTRSQYGGWLATNPDPASGQPSYCGWNTDFHADATCMSDTHVCKGTGCGKRPQECVDWCDAYAYCKAVDKRLCGKIGGGANGYDDNANAALSQWFNACSSDGQNHYPYGVTYDPQKCNGMENAVFGCTGGGCSTTAVGSLPGCQSSVAGYEGVYDLSGSVWEWEDSCSAPTESITDCRIRGGSFGNPASDLHCDGHKWYRAGVDFGLGFRCCAGP